VKYLFYSAISTILFFAFSPGQFTPEIVGTHDKLAHFCAFFVLSFGMNFSFPAYSIKRIFIVMVLLAAGIEVVQQYCPGRFVSVDDFSAGMAGVFVYLAILKIMTEIGNVFAESSNASS
jgi:VanZ family protein